MLSTQVDIITQKLYSLLFGCCMRDMLLTCVMSQAALDSGVCQRIYLTEIMTEFECDVFLPEFDRNLYLPMRQVSPGALSSAAVLHIVAHHTVLFGK